MVEPLSQALSAALAQSHQARSPEEAQLQVQAQWSATGKIQIQLQGQISDENITAQAQRQDLFAPNY